MSDVTDLRVVIAPYLFVVGEECMAKDVACWLADERVPDGTVFENRGEYWVALDDRLVECDQTGAPIEPLRELYPSHLYKYLAKQAIDVCRAVSVLVVIEQADEILTYSEIADRASVPYSDITHQLDVLLRRGYISRGEVINPWDPRGVWITDTGKEWLRDARKVR